MHVFTEEHADCWDHNRFPVLDFLSELESLKVTIVADFFIIWIPLKSQKVNTIKLPPIMGLCFIDWEITQPWVLKLPCREPLPGKGGT